MLRTVKRMHIDAKPDEVLDFLVDASREAPGTSTEPVHESPDRVGDSFEWTFKMLGMRFSGITVITEYVPGERLTVRDFGAMEGTAKWTVEPEEDGSRVTAEVESRIAIPLIGRLFDPILQREFDKNIAWGIRELERQEPEVVAAA